LTGGANAQVCRHVRGFSSYFVERTFSPVFQVCIEKHKPSDEKGVAEKNKTFGIAVALDSNVRCTGEFIDANNGAITALATIVIAAFTGTLWIATSTQARLTREAFVADKRAFVFAKGIVGIYEADPVSGHFNWRVAPVWENSGDTPTRDLRIYTDGWFSNAPIPADFNFNTITPPVQPANGLLGPKVSNNGGQYPHFPHQAALTPQDILDVQTGRKFFYVWRWARYRDILPDTPEHITRFCWRVLFTGSPFAFNPLVNANGVTVSNHYENRGNCTDEECRSQGLG
jgi:hypothetical protein